jgi:hypothetical protein
VSIEDGAVKADFHEEATAAAGVKIDSSGGAGTTTTIKDGVIHALSLYEAANSKQWVRFNDGTATCDIDGDDYIEMVADVSITLNAPMTYCGTAGGGDLTVDDITGGDISAAKVTIGTTGGGNVARVLHSEWVNGTTAGTGSSEGLDQITVAAGTLAATGDSLEVEARYQATVANACIFGIGFNGFSNPEQNVTLSATGSLIARSTITRTGAATGRMTFETEYGTANYVADEMDINVTWANSSTLEIKLRTPTTIGDCYLKSDRVMFVPAVTP